MAFGSPPRHLPNLGVPKGVHPVMRGQHGEVVVRHPKLPGPQMMAASQDYAELPSGSLSQGSSPGGITGGLAPFQSAAGAEGGEFQGG
jgi:hypothetical protein